jgi:hypothetical protein
MLWCDTMLMLLAAVNDAGSISGGCIRHDTA